MNSSFISLGAILLALPAVAAEGFSEPPAILYGKVIHLDAGATYQVFDGDLTVTLTSDDAAANSVTLTGQLRATGTNGVFSYQIDVPQQYLPSSDQLDDTLAVDGGSTKFFFESVTIDGVPAEPLDSAQSLFFTSFSKRAQEHRLDLKVTLPQDDTDGDAMPDWWEEQNGLNPLFAGDAADDLDGDGIDNLGEFRGATDPNVNDNAPSIATTSLLVPSGGEAGLYFAIVDADLVTSASTPSDIHLAFDQNISGLEFWSSTNGQLAPGQLFTYQDILAGEISIKVSRAFTEAALELSVIDALTPAQTFSHDLLIRSFNPDNANPSIWLDLEALTATSDGPIDEWADFTTHNRDGFQPAADKRPSWSSSAPSLSFDGSDDFLYVDDRALTLGNFSAFFAFEINAFNTDDHTLFRHNDLEVSIGGTANGSQAQSLIVRESGREIAGPALSTAQGNQFTIVHSPDSSYLTRAGESFTPSDTTNEILAPGFSTLAAHREFTDSEPHRFFNGNISEVIVFADDMGPGNRSRVEDYQLSRWSSVVVWDYRSETIPMTITGFSGRRNSISGGWSLDTLNGSDQSDILRGGPAIDLLTGNGGGDRFQFFKGDGDDIVTDFDESEGDVIDLSPIFGSAQGDPSHYVFIRTEVGRDENNSPVVNSILELDCDGGLDDIDQRITLRGHLYTQLDLPRLVGEGFIQLGGPQFDTVMAVAAAQSDIIETEVARTLTLTRTGNLDAELTVQLSFVGSAMIGTDFTVSNCGPDNGVVVHACFPRGESTTTIDLIPIQDQLDESETITVTILPSPKISEIPAPVVISLKDAPLVSIATVNEYAERIGPVPGSFELARTGPTDEPLEVALGFAGSAENGVDYSSLPENFTFPIGVAKVQLQVTPSGVPLPAASKTADISVLEDKTRYALAPATKSTIFILDEAFAFAEFRDDHFPGDNADDQTLGARDDDNDREANAFEYAYGTDPNKIDSPRGSLRMTRLPDGHVQLDLRTRNGLINASFSVHNSPDLRNWTEVTANFKLETTILPDGRVQRLYRSLEPTTTTNDYYRIGITITTEP